MVHANSIELTPAIRNYVEEKVGLIEKILSPEENKLTEARVEIGKPSRHHYSGAVFYSEINLNMGRRFLRAESSHEDLYTAINSTRGDIERQIRKYKTKLLAKRRKTG